MPDLVTVIARRWKLMLLLTLTATVLALLICLIMPEKYVGVTTALTANPALSDKARIFNQNIEALYTALGSPDDLDRIEGTARLDTIYLALAKDFNLVAHYGINGNEPTALTQAAAQLKQNTAVNRTGYGELRIKVWDKENHLAAALANAAMQVLNNIHQQVQTENSRLILQRLKEEQAQTQQALRHTAGEAMGIKSPNQTREDVTTDSGLMQQNLPTANPAEEAHTLRAQLAQYTRMISEYELALKTAPKVLLVVEHARPSPSPDRPKTGQVVLIATFAALVFSFLLALVIDSRSSAA